MFLESIEFIQLIRKFKNDDKPVLTRERARQLAIDAFVSACERETNTGDAVSTTFFPGTARYY